MPGAIDYMKLLSKLDPQPGGEDTARMRTGIVDAVNSDGTIDLAISGIVVPDVPRLEGTVAAVNTVVQVISYRGSLLVIGSVAADNDWDAGRVIHYASNATDSAAGGSGAEAAMLTSGADLIAGVPYRIWFNLHVATTPSPGVGTNRIRLGSGLAGTVIQTEFADYPTASGTIGNRFTMSTRYVPGSTGNQLFTFTAQVTGQTARREAGTDHLAEMWIERWL